MEQPKQEGGNKPPISRDDKSPKSDPKEVDQTANGDGNWGNFVMGSENKIPTQNEQPAISTPSSGSKKSVRWSTELVTESPSVASNAYGSNSHASLAPSSSISFKGSFSDFDIWFCFIDLYMCHRAATVSFCVSLIFDAF